MDHCTKAKMAQHSTTVLLAVVVVLAACLPCVLGGRVMPWVTHTPANEFSWQVADPLTLCVPGVSGALW